MKNYFNEWVSGLGLLLFVAALFLVFLYAPVEATMGVVQKIFYFHVPIAWVAFLAFFITFLGSILYLWKRDRKWDHLASASAEVGVIFTTLVLITGSIWAKPMWGTWWVWEPRLTTSLALWFIYVAYLIVRSYVTEESRGARFAAIVGIVGFIDVPIVALAITLWRTQHPEALVFKGGLTPAMLQTLLVCIVTFTLLYVLLLIQTIAIKNNEDRLKIMRNKLI